MFLFSGFVLATIFCLLSYLESAFLSKLLLFLRCFCLRYARSDAFQIIPDTQLEYDILEYVVIERLAQSGRDKLKDDGINLSDWLQSLASFWGHLYVFFFENINTLYMLEIVSLRF